MSDFFEGPGHWMASDGKWYPPERHPDPEYRDRFAAPPLTPPRVPDTLGSPGASAKAESQEVADAEPIDVAEEIDPDHGGEPDAEDEKTSVGEFPSVGLRDHEPLSVSKPLADLHHTSAEPDQAPREFSVASTDFGAVPERPVFETPTAPASVSPVPSISSRPDRVPDVDRRGDRGGAPGIQLEFGNESSTTRPGVGGSPLTPAKLSTSTALAVIPTPTIETHAVATVDRILAAIIFCAGVAMIVGTFLDWSAGSVIQTGWDRGDGIATVIAGVLGSACAGPVYVGYRHILPKAMAIIAGLVGLVVVGLSAGSVLLDSDTAATSLGNGAIVAAVGAAAMVLAGLFHRIDHTY